MLSGQRAPKLMAPVNKDDGIYMPNVLNTEIVFKSKSGLLGLTSRERGSVFGNLADSDLFLCTWASLEDCSEPGAEKPESPRAFCLEVQLMAKPTPPEVTLKLPITWKPSSRNPSYLTFALFFILLYGHSHNSTTPAIHLDSVII